MGMLSQNLSIIDVFLLCVLVCFIGQFVLVLCMWHVSNDCLIDMRTYVDF